MRHLLLTLAAVSSGVFVGAAGYSAIMACQSRYSNRLVSRVFRGYKGYLDAKVSDAGPATKFAKLGLKNGDRLLAAQVITGVVFAFSSVRSNSLDLIHILGSVALFTAGAYLPVIILERMARTRRHRILVEMPGTLEIIALALQAGLSFDAAVDYVVDKTSGALGGLFRKGRAAIAAGTNRESAYAAMSAEGPAELKTFLETVLQAERQGKPVGDAILGIADSLRLKHSVRFELRANRLPATMLLPIFIFIVPPVLVVYLLPAIVNLRFMSL